MIDLKNKNFITGNKYDVQMSLYKIVDFFDLTGYNMLYLQNPNLSYPHKYNISQLDFNSIKNAEEILDDDSNLFRVDLIIIDLYSMDIDNIQRVSNKLNEKNIKFIILTNDYSYNKSDNDLNVYEIVRKVETNNNPLWEMESIYYVYDKINKTNYSFDDYMKSIKRKIKINKLLDN